MSFFSGGLLNPARRAGETYPDYKSRRKAGNRAVEYHLKGKLVHKATSRVDVPLAGADEKIDEAIRSGELLVVTQKFLKRNTFVRVVLTKGITYRKAKT